MEHEPMISRKRRSSVKITRWMSRRVRVTNSACASVLGSSASNAAGEGRARVSTTLMSEVLCTAGQIAARGGGNQDSTSREEVKAAPAGLILERLDAAKSGLGIFLPRKGAKKSLATAGASMRL